MNKLYQGKLFGKDGAIGTLANHVFKDGGSYLTTFLPDFANLLSGLVSGAINMVKGLVTGNKGQREQGQNQASNAINNTGTGNAIQHLMAVKALRGTTIPYIEGQRALLTGDPIGDWHLTIGNPFNPIAMIGNLIVKNCEITWEDELGPDDFPIGFKAVITLDHGLGRDKDAIESMYNRGYGRIYTLPSEFRSSADGETKVDDYTGGVNTPEGRTKYEETRNTYFGGGTRFIAKTQTSELQNKGRKYEGEVQELPSLKPTSIQDKSAQTVSSYYVNPWQMGYTL